MSDLLRDRRIDAFGLFVEAERRLIRTFEQTLRDLHELSIVEFEAMLRLGRSDGGHVAMSTLADQMVLTSGGATRLIDRLVDRGFVERVPCPTDRRVQWVRLTGTGGRALDEALHSHLDDLERHYSGVMTLTELETVTAVMDRLRQECAGS